MVLRLHQHNIGYTADGFYRSDDATNSVKALKEGLDWIEHGFTSAPGGWRVVSHPDRPRSNQAHLTVLQ